MKSFLLVIASIGVTVACWGAYGPVLHWGQGAMEGSRLRPLVCVGLAYFLIAVVVPMSMLQTSGESGSWTFWGTVWSVAAGAAGAIGALGIIMAFSFGGKPVYVMPLVFGCAPVVNTFLTIAVSKSWKDINPIFYAGLTLVAVGAAMVLIFAPKPKKKPQAQPAAVKTDAMISPTHPAKAEKATADTAKEKTTEVATSLTKENDSDKV